MMNLSENENKKIGYHKRSEIWMFFHEWKIRKKNKKQLRTENDGKMIWTMIDFDWKVKLNLIRLLWKKILEIFKPFMIMIRARRSMRTVQR